MSDPSEVARHEWELLATVDGAVRAVLDAATAEGAYEALFGVGAALLDDPDMPNVGRLYCAWADLEDLFEIGLSGPPRVLSVYRTAARGWLDRPDVSSNDWIGSWVQTTGDLVSACFEQDGSLVEGPSLIPRNRRWWRRFIAPT